MPIWEYRIVRLGPLSEQEEALNSLGADRWEVVSIVAEGSESRAYLKRESVFSMSAMPPMPPPEMFGERPPTMTRSSVPVMQTHATLRLSAKDDPAVVGWLDSGLDLDETCAGISIAIDGEVLVSSGEAVDSEGSPTSMALNPAIGEELAQRLHRGQDRRARRCGACALLRIPGLRRQGPPVRDDKRRLL